MDEENEFEEAEQQDSRHFKQMRERAEKAEQRAKELEKTLLERTIKDAGFDPSLEITQLVAERYDGDFDADAFKAFATAKGLTPPSKPDTAAQDAAGQTAAEQEFGKLQSVGDELRNVSSQQEPPDIRAQIADLESRVNASTDAKEKQRLMQESAALKSQLSRRKAS